MRQREEMLERKHELDLMDLNIFGVVFGKRGEKEGENISRLWPPRPSLTERQADKVLAHGRMQVSGEECFGSRIGSYQGSLKDKLTAPG